jgi:hypothetical protein
VAVTDVASRLAVVLMDAAFMFAVETFAGA